MKIDPLPALIRREDKILSIGSCFSESVGELLKKDGYDIEINPPGILFNPHSIEKCFRNALEEKVDEGHFGTYMDAYFHFDYHSRMNGLNQENVRTNIQSHLQKIKKLLMAGDCLILTFGTAWVYQLSKTEQIVANCHKVPQKEFTKVLLDLDILKEQWKNLIGDLHQLNPKLKILLTVSPIRHTRKGIHENNVSKSVLLLLSDFLEKKFECVQYFPSYEIVLDELRDYEFFKEDMIHPTDESISIIYERLKAAYL